MLTVGSLYDAIQHLRARSDDPSSRIEEGSVVRCRHVCGVMGLRWEVQVSREGMGRQDLAHCVVELRAGREEKAVEILGV